MKMLYQLNKIMIIIWAGLMCTIEFGLLFMILMDGIQVLSSVYLLIGKKWITKQIRNGLLIYLILSTAVVLMFFVPDFAFDWAIYLLVISGFLALYLTYCIYKETELQ